MKTLGNMRRMTHRRDEKGFSLIEVLTVMLILGLLSAIAVPIYMNQKKVAYQAALKSDVSNALIAMSNDKLDGLYGVALPSSFVVSNGVRLTVHTSTNKQSTCVDGNHSSAPTETWSASSLTKSISNTACP